jgi:hypothetical protein
LIRARLKGLARRLRLVRGAAGALRLLTLGLALAAALLLFKGLLKGAEGWPVVILVVGFPAVGALYGLLAPLPLSRVARLADRRLGLKERLTAAIEQLATPGSDIARAQLAETAGRVRDLEPAAAFPLAVGREARLAGPLAALALALVLLPPIPLELAARRDADESPATPAEEPERAERRLEQKLAKPALPQEILPKGSERSVQRGPLSARSPHGDQAAVFKDTKLSQERPDFGSFLKQGDDRLKLLARPETLPDLSRDFTQSPHQVMIRQMQSQLRSKGMQGLSWEQIERLLSELGQSQRGGGGEIPDDLLKELQGQKDGGSDKMLSALSRALNRLRERDASARGEGKSLREAPGQSGTGRGKGEPGAEGSGKEDGAPGGSLPGTEKSLQTTGVPTPRIGGEKQDANLEGELREGEKEAYDTNLSGRGAQNASRLRYLEAFSQYRKQMEEALAKEPIPFSYREQVREYFKALEAQ